jgi:hypothetical protein
MTLLTESRDAGVKFRIVGGKLEAKNLDKVSPDLQSEIRARTKELKELLKAEMVVWNFRKIRIPSQVTRGSVDVWMVGTREDRPAYRWWFVRTEQVCES